MCYFEFCKTWYFKFLLWCGFICVLIAAVIIKWKTTYSGYYTTLRDNHSVNSFITVGNKQQYINQMMLSKTVHICENLYLYSCGANTGSDHSKYMTHVQGILNDTITTTDKNSYFDVYYKDSYNKNMDIFYNLCINYHVNFNTIKRLRLCGDYNLHWIINQIKNINEKTNINDIIQIISSLTTVCSMNTPFVIEENYEIFNEGERRKGIYIHSRNDNYKGKKNDVHDLSLILFDEHVDDIGEHLHDRFLSYKYYDEKENFCTDMKTFKQAFPVLHHIISGRETYSRNNHLFICTSTDGYLKYFESMIKTVDKKSIKHYFYYIIVNTILHEISISGKGKSCLEKTITSFPMSYYNATAARIYGLKEHISIAINETKKFISMISSDILDMNDIQECIHTSYIQTLKTLNVQFGSFHNILQKEKQIFHNHQNEIQLFSDGRNFNYLEASFHIRNNTFFETNMNNHNPKYDARRHTVIVPLAMLIEPRFSKHHDDIGRMGTFLFMIGHEIAHSLLRTHVVDSNCIKKIYGIHNDKTIDIENICDVISVSLLKNILYRTNKIDSTQELATTISQYLCNEMYQSNRLKQRINIIHKVTKDVFNCK